MGAFGLLASTNYSLIAVTSLTRLNCQSSVVYRRSERSQCNYQFFKNAFCYICPVSCPSICPHSRFCSFVLSLGVNLRHRKDLKPERTSEYKSRKEVVLHLARLPPCRSANRVTISIDETLARGRYLPRATVLLEQSL